MTLSPLTEQQKNPYANAHANGNSERREQNPSVEDRSRGWDGCHEAAQGKDRKEDHSRDEQTYAVVRDTGVSFADDAEPYWYTELSLEMAAVWDQYVPLLDECVHDRECVDVPEVLEDVK